MFELSQYPLPYKKNVLEPYISENTMNFHYEKHLAGYITNLNNLIKGTQFDGESLKRIIIKSSHSKDTRYIFNNAAQIFNHNFFFNCLKSRKSELIASCRLVSLINSCSPFKIN